jgi:hypothetical protein
MSFAKLYIFICLWVKVYQNLLMYFGDKSTNSQASYLIDGPYGAPALSIMTLSITTLSITYRAVMLNVIYAKCQLCCVASKPSMLSAIMLSVVAPHVLLVRKQNYCLQQMPT